jgi:hypothetical protein
MKNISPTELFGYFGSFIVALSLTMSDMYWLRIFNLAGALIFVVYGFIIKSYPVAFLNLFITAANIYYLNALSNPTP